jgi:hypothetical protein
MRTFSRLALLSMVIGSTFAFADPPDLKGPPVKAEAPPPPGINDPGVTTAEPPAAQQGAAQAAAAADNNAVDPLAPLPKPDTRIVRDKSARDASANSQRVAASEVSTRKQGSDTVQEYRQNGHVWMIRIVPQYGPTQTFMDTTGTGRLTRDPQEGPVSPVYFSLYEWN